MSRTSFLRVIATLTLVVWTAHAHGQVSWNNPAGGSFHAPANWTPAGPPGPAQIANFNLNSATYTVIFPTAVNNAGLTVNGNANNVTLDLGGNTYTLTSGIQNHLGVGSVGGANADLRIVNGTVHRAGAGVVGLGGGTGDVFIGAGGALTLTSYLDIGGPGSIGAVHLLDGGDLVMGGGSYIGNGGSGSVDLTGAGSTFNPTGGVVIGQSGSGVVNVFNGASANLATNTILALAAGSTGSLRVEGVGASVVADSLDIGSQGTGRVIVRNQGLLTTTGQIESATNAVGRAEIELESTWNHSSGSIFLGGTASNSSGGAANFRVGFGGVLNLTGPGNALKLWSSNAVLNVDGGVVNVRSLDAAAGRIQLTGGIINVNGGALTTSGTSLDSISSGIITVDSGSWNHTGSVVLAHPGFLGVQLLDGTAGTVTGEFQVNGPNNLTVRDGSTLNTDRLLVGWAASPSPSGATVVVSNGVINIPSTGYMILGNGGNGTVSIQNGGRIDTHDAHVFTGYSAGGTTSTINIEHPGSVLTLGNGLLQLGAEATTTSNLNVTAGGRLNARFVFAARNAGAVANINVTGNGSVLNASELLVLGASILSAGGTSNVSIGPGATVNTPSLYIWTGANVQLNGGTLAVTNLERKGGGLAFNSGTLRFAGDLVTDPALTSFITGGDATLSAGQTLEAGGTTTLASPLKLDGGTLRTGVLAGGTLLDLQRGTLDVTSDNFQIAANGTLGPTVVLGPQQHVAASNPGSFLSIARQGVLMLSGGTFTFGNNTASENLGEIHLDSDLSLLKGGTFINRGLITGTGRVDVTLGNTASGEVRVLDGQHLRFIAGVHSNEGTIHVEGGSVDFSLLTNLATVDVQGGSFRATSAMANSGVFSARDSVLRFVGGLNNNAGTLGLSFGTSDIFGAVTNNSGGKTIVSGNSRATFNGPVTNNAGGELRVSTGSTAVFFAPVTNNGLITGGGSKFFELGGSNLGPLATSGSTTVAEPASITATHIREAALTVAGRVTIGPNGTQLGTSRVRTLAISEGGVMDLSNNDLVIEGGDLADVTQLIADGRLTTGSATALATLGVLLNGSRYTTFSGQNVSQDDVLVKYTYFGDTNLDGRVNIVDYLVMDRGFARGATGWANGDLDYSGVIDGADFFLIDQAFLGQGAPLASQIVAAVVPEPAALSLVLLAAMLLRRRQGRQM